MKLNQTSIRNGVEDILIPMEHFRFTQGDKEGNHPWYACDMAGKDTGKDKAYFPFSAVCKSINPNDGNAVWWESQNPVRFADGTVDYCTLMILHDEGLEGIFVGAKYPQGHQMAVEGTKMGNKIGAVGAHLHIEFAKSRFSHQYDKNAKGYYLPNGIAIETVCFADGTIFLNASNWNWKYTKDVPVSAPAPTPTPPRPSAPNTDHLEVHLENGTFTLTVDKINFRNFPTTSANVEGNYTKGMSVNYDQYVRNEGYVWISWVSISKGVRRYMACRVVETNEAWGKFK